MSFSRVRDRRSWVAAALVSALAGLGLVTSSPAQAAEVLTIQGSTTDNYKEFGSGSNQTASSVNFESVTFGGTRYVVDLATWPGESALGAPHPAEEYELPGLPIKPAGGAFAGQYLVVDPVPDADQGCCWQAQYRVFSATGVMGLYIAVKDYRTNEYFKTHPVSLGLRVVKSGTVQASTSVRYSYDAAVAGMADNAGSPEYKGPGGRWDVAGTKTPLDWPSSLPVTPTQVVAGAPTQLTVTPRDNIGLALPLYSRPVSLTWSPAIGQPTSADGTGRRVITATLPAGTYTVTAASTCDYKCSPSTATTIVSAAEQAQPTLAIGDVVTSEGTGGTTQMQFTVSRSGATSGSSTVQVGHVPGTATSPADYTLSTTSVAFAAGASTAQATVTLVADDVEEPDETFTLRLTGATGATISDAEAVGTILNDDTAPPSTAYGVDEQIRRKPNGAYFGAGPDANVVVRLKRGATYDYMLRVLNTGEVADSFAMVGTPSQSGVKVTYLQGKVDRTAQFVAGDASTGQLAVQTPRYYTVRLRVGPNAVRGSEKLFTLTAVSNGAYLAGQQVRDRLRIRVVVS